jgi:AcrR family transcriptional regulator
MNTDRRTERTRRALRNAMTMLMMEKTYDSISVQEITERANVGRTTFYLHFRDKDELLLDCFSWVDKIITQYVHRLYMGEADAHTALIMLFEHPQEHYTLYRALAFQHGYTVISRRLGEHVAESLQKRLKPHADIPADILAQHVVGSLVWLLLWWLDCKMPYSAEYMAETFHRLVWQGVSGLL